tara:strand:- start:247 stop:630 length:384 start_codon:yes stop_codon:yes gene_type:complete
MSKEQLETNLAALKLLQNETNEKLTDHKVQISLLEKELADINKPELTPSQLDDVHEAIEKGVGEFDFSDSDNYNIEYGIDYDGKVNCESLELCNHGDLVELIVKEVHELFVETEDDITEANSSFGND